MPKKKKSEWEGEEAPECPNNSRHDGLTPDPNGAWRCNQCFEERKPRSREAYRWAFVQKQKGEAAHE